MKCVLLCVALAAPAPVQDKIVPPKGLPPSWATAVMREGKLTLQFSVLVPVVRTETRQRTVNVGGREVVETYQVNVTSYQIRHVMTQIDKARYYDTAGKEINADRAARRLSKETVVLLSADGKPLDPYYLRTVKDGTLTVVRPVEGGPFVPGVALPTPTPRPPLPPR